MREDWFKAARRGKVLRESVTAFSMLSFLVFAGLTACKDDPSISKMQYVPDMADAPTVKAQESFLEPPEGSISLNTAIYPDTVEEAEKSLFMPAELQQDSQAEVAGEHLWDTYCVVCHGPTGHGDGSVTDLFPRPPDLTLPVYQERTDGFFFYRITFGSAIMPSYGDKIDIAERWQIVKYLRKLQKAGQ